MDISARNHVLSISELLTAIITHLPMRDLLVNVQRVGRSWYDVVKSQSMQQILFFAQSSPTEPVCNSLLLEVFPFWFNIPGATRPSHVQSIEDLDWATSPAKRFAYSRKEASWRNMLVVQPPARTLGIMQGTTFQMRTRKKVGIIEFKDGLRMGAFFNYAREKVSSLDWWFRVQWHIFILVHDTSVEDTLNQTASLGSLKVMIRTNRMVRCLRRILRENDPDQERGIRGAQGYLWRRYKSPMELGLIVSLENKEMW